MCAWHVCTLADVACMHAGWCGMYARWLVWHVCTLADVACILAGWLTWHVCMLAYRLEAGMMALTPSRLTTAGVIPAEMHCMELICVASSSRAARSAF